MAIDLKNKIVFITGASSGIGEACARMYAKAGAKLIITARRVERLKQLAGELENTYNTSVLPLELDVQNVKKVEATIDSLSNDWNNIDILINNAGLALESVKFQAGNPCHWDTMIQTNIAGLLYVTHAILPHMIKRNRGHIVNIGSVAGYEAYTGGNVYSATKYAVRGISKSLRVDLMGHNLRVTEICPGAVHTEFSEVRWKDKARADSFYADFEALQADDIADAVVYCTTRPLHVDVSEMHIFPTAQASCNHIHKAQGAAGGLFDK